MNNIIPLSNTTYGDEYIISYDALYAAINKDGTTLFDTIDKVGDYELK